MKTRISGWWMVVALVLALVAAGTATPALAQAECSLMDRQALADCQLMWPYYWTTDEGQFDRQALADYMLTQPVYVAPAVEPAVVIAPSQTD